MVKDYASISAQNPGIGQNIDEYGPRFFDISTMFDSKFTTLIETTIADNSSVKSVSGDIFWVNNSAVVHGTVFNKMAEFLSNDRVN